MATMSVFTLPASYRFRKVTVQAGKQTGRGGKGKDSERSDRKKNDMFVFRHAWTHWLLPMGL